MSILPSLFGGSLLTRFSDLPRIQPPSGDASSTSVASLLSPAVLAVPVLCRDPAHAVIDNGPITCNDPQHATAMSALSRPGYLQFINCGFEYGSTMPPLDLIMDDDGEILASLSAAAWDGIRHRALKSAPPQKTLPVLTHTPAGLEIVYMLLGMRQDYTFPVLDDFPLEWIERAPDGIFFKILLVLGP